MPVFYLHDRRVSGATPRCDVPVQIGPGDSLVKVVERLAHQIDAELPAPAWYHILHILCHGTPDGLQLGSPNATQRNIRAAFTPLRGRVGAIEIHGCGAAAIYDRGNPPLGSYDGGLFCSELARTVACRVTASDATQFYIPSESIVNRSGTNRLARWQGNVGTWGPNGQLLGVTTQRQRTFGQ